jgi:hypothetical protein
MSTAGGTNPNPTGGANPNPNPANGAPVITTDAQLMQILLSVDQGTTTTRNSPPNLRVGGSNAVESWTVKGAQGLRTNPKSGMCMRSLKGNELKAYQALNNVEEKCKGGSQSKGTSAFGLPGESHYDKGALLLRELHEYLSNH